MGLDLNNFYGYFPGGFYRGFAAKPKVCDDLDRVLSEMGFDISRFSELMGRQKRMFDEAIKLAKASLQGPLTPEEQEREKQIEIENGEVNQTLNQLMEPAYQKMRDLGYTHRQLVG